MFPCSSCHRHVRLVPSADASCPFCGAALRDTAAPVTFAGLLLGLSLMGCGDRTVDDDAAGDTGTAASESESASTSTSASGTQSTTQNNEENAEAADYGGAETWSEEDTSVEESATTTSTDSGSTGTGGSDSGSTDTGVTTTDASAEGADYGAAPPSDPDL